MSEMLYKLLKPTQTLQNALPKIIEAFVSYYGEENREYIENKFKNMILIGYGFPNRASDILIRIKSSLTKKLINKFMNDLKVPIENRDKLSKLLFSNYTFDHFSLIPLQKYIDYKKISKKEMGYEYLKQETLEFLKSINPGVTLDNMDRLIRKRVFSDVDKLIPKYQEIINLYNEEINKLSVYIEEESKNRKLKSEIEKKYFVQLISEFSDLLPLNEINKINERINEGFFSTLGLPFTNSYFGSILISTPLIDSFSKENDMVLISGKSWQIQSVKKDRINFFNEMGIDLGDDYSLYENNSECQKLIPSQESIEKINLRRKELNDVALNEFYKSTKEYQKYRQIINERNLILKDDGFDPYLYFNNLTCICPNLTIKEGKVQVNPIVFINAHITEHLDASIIHELNHAFELDLMSISDNVFKFSCGWDVASCSISPSTCVVQKLEERKEQRKYELFNEIINELIAQEITIILHNSKNYIFNDKSTAEIKGGTTYEHTIPLIKDFYVAYKKEILESRKARNMEPLFDKIGKDNFDTLNNLFHEFNESFDGFKIYSLYADLRKNKDTDLTRKYYALLSKRDNILNEMNEYSLRHRNHL